MNLRDLREWIHSENGLAKDLEQLSKYSAARGLTLEQLEQDLRDYQPDWPRLMLAGSVCAFADEAKYALTALQIAQAGLQYSGDSGIADASATILGQLANHRAIKLAESRGLLQGGIENRLGVVESILAARRELNQTLFLAKGQTILANQFQRRFWDQLNDNAWVSASAPTASGKTYLILQWLLNWLVATPSSLVVFLAPTRALVGEVERELRDLSAIAGVVGLRIASLPMAQFGDGTRSTILVFTQERLHAFLNACVTPPTIDLLVVDEAQKVGDGLRGVVLQDAIERIQSINAKVRVVFLSPLTTNPEALLDDAPPAMKTGAIPDAAPTVTQNLFVAEQMPGDTKKWKISLQQGERRLSIGQFQLHAKPDNQTKRLSYLALAVGRNQTGTLIYANGAAEAEKVSQQLFDALGGPLNRENIDPELRELSDFAKSIVHEDFQLVDVVQRGVAFHYGNMPTLLRSEIERLFRTGKIRFLVCTSTLVEGVNLACRTILARGPKKGRGKPMQPHDFWNLAGRAGRWGYDFNGNIVCVDIGRTDLWPEGVPKKANYPIARETDTVLAKQNDVLTYFGSRLSMEIATINPDLEQLLAYLLNWRARAGPIVSAPIAKRFDRGYITAVDEVLASLLSAVDLPSGIIVRHPGVSAVALQALLAYFRKREKSPETLLPSSPESDDAYERLIAAFHRINQHLYPAFLPAGAIPIHALVTVEWMRGYSLNHIIRNRITYLARKKQPFKIAAVIRDTMRDVEEVARFRAPKFLSAYLDVLKFHLEAIGQAELFPADLRFDLFLEFGVSTATLLSMIQLGLSRTSAVAINDFLGADDLSEQQVLGRLANRRWQTLDIPNVVKREIEQLLERASPSAA